MDITDGRDSRNEGSTCCCFGMVIDVDAAVAFVTFQGGPAAPLKKCTPYRLDWYGSCFSCLGSQYF